MAAKSKSSKKTDTKSTKEKNSKQDVNNTSQFGQLRRSETDSVIAGVAGGIGKFFNIDSTIVRIVFAVLTVFGGSGLLLYFILWLIMPSENSLSNNSGEAIEENKEDIKLKAQHAAENIRYETSNEGNKKSNFAIILVVLGIYFLLKNLGFLRSIDLGKFWPVILIFLGLLILFNNDKK